MCIGIEQYRMRVGLFKDYLKNRHVLTYKDFFCINLIIFARNKSSAVGIAIFINFFINLSPQVKHSKSETVCQNIKVNGSDVVLDRISYLAVFILFVIQMLLIISGLETNPGPEDDSDIRIGSLNSIDVSSFCDKFSSSVSFLHLNIQSIIPKLDLIAAEYEDFDILSFSESWLNSNHTDESIKLLNFHTPFRSDRGPHKMGGGVVVYIRDNINVTRRFDLEMDNLEAVWLQLKLEGKKVLFGTFPSEQ